MAEHRQAAWIRSFTASLQAVSSIRSPTAPLLLGLAITLAVMVTYSCYLSRQISRLRTLQRELADRNRKDSLLLLRIQNDLNTLALGMRDMLDTDEQYPLTAWEGEFDRIRGDLSDAFRKEDLVAVTNRSALQRQYLATSVGQFWDAVDRMFSLAHNGRKPEALAQLRLSLQARQSALSNTVARLLVANNESEELAAQRAASIYDGVQRQAYVFLGAGLATILLTTLYLIHASRQLFARLSLLSQQRGELAQRLISTQESTLRHVSRELHDEFGQILTAIGALLSRVRNRFPEESHMRSELLEICAITQSALDNVRSFSQALHPVILDETGLESALDWYLPKVQRQTRVAVLYEKSGTRFGLENSAAIHIYRVLQEALNNAIRHSGASQVWVRLHYLCGALILEIEDHGSGFPVQPALQGIGLTGMRERAKLLGGQIEFIGALPTGTLVRLTVPENKCGLP